MTTAPALGDLDIISSEVYRTTGYPWHAWDALRRDAPVYWYDRPGVTPFWAITKHTDILAISKAPDIFVSSQRLVISDREQEATATDNVELRQHHILTMDPPEHGKYRNLVSRRFTPRGLAVLEPHVEELSQGIISDVAMRLVDQVSKVGHADFVGDLAAKLPVFVITEMIGVPREDAELMFEWTNESIGAGDPEYQKGRTAQETGRTALMNMFGYFAKLLGERKQKPKNDLISVLIKSEVDGQQISDMDIIAYCFLLVVAGNETTRNATSGGMLTLIEHPDQMAKLRDDPSLAPSAVEEMLRFVSPIIHFARTAVSDTEIRGQKIAAGEAVTMFYPSANRDEEVFDDPYTFDILRSPNDHLAFGGFGEHFCLGSNLARMELQIIFKELLQRLPVIELDGPVERLSSTLVGGIKHMPVRFRPRG
jgi:cholest-4-en-3-one 26-monooxygenase